MQFKLLYHAANDPNMVWWSKSKLGYIRGPYTMVYQDQRKVIKYAVEVWAPDSDVNRHFVTVRMIWRIRWLEAVLVVLY